jgi:hypothetical protein
MISEARKPDSGLMGWKCSSCTELITSIENGWVEWLTTETERGTMLHGLNGSTKKLSRVILERTAAATIPELNFAGIRLWSRVCRSKDL